MNKTPTTRTLTQLPQGTLRSPFSSCRLRRGRLKCKQVVARKFSIALLLPPSSEQHLKKEASAKQNEEKKKKRAQEKVSAGEHLAVESRAGSSRVCWPFCKYERFL